MEQKITCKVCGSEDVDVKAWINQKTGAISGETNEDQDTWCNECEDHTGVKVENI